MEVEGLTLFGFYFQSIQFQRRILLNIINFIWLNLTLNQVIAK